MSLSPQSWLERFSRLGTADYLASDLFRSCREANPSLLLQDSSCIPAGTPCRRENRAGCPPTPDACLVVEAVRQFGAGARSGGSRTVASSTPIRVSVPNRAPGQPQPTLRDKELWWFQTADRSRSKSTSRSWSGSPRSMWPRRQGWCARGCRTRPYRASASPGCGRWQRPPTRSSRWLIS
jgi:hypothetical protein